MSPINQKIIVGSVLVASTLLSISAMVAFYRPAPQQAVHPLMQPVPDWSKMTDQEILDQLTAGPYGLEESDARAAIKGYRETGK